MNPTVFDILIAASIFCYCLFVLILIRELRTDTKALDQQESWDAHVSTTPGMIDSI